MTSRAEQREATAPLPIPPVVEASADYDGPEAQPFTGYTGVLATYGVVAGTALAVAVRQGRLPERVPASDVVLFGIATHKLARTLTKDAVTSPIRAPFTQYQGHAGPGERMERPRRRGAARAVGELLTCPFCAGQWIASGFVLGSVFAPRPTRVVASIFAARAAADWLHFGYAAMERLATGDRHP